MLFFVFKGGKTMYSFFILLEVACHTLLKVLLETCPILLRSALRTFMSKYLGVCP